MCGIIGFCGPNEQHTRELLSNLIVESAYRGKHSTGICWVNRDGEFSLAFPDLTLSELQCWMELAFYGLEQIQVITHNRYCTSDPDSPMPILDGNKAIVLNGVITQEPFESWPTYGPLPYSTRNDAEIMLRLAHQGRVHETPGSYAACFLSNDGILVGVRSPERPLWWHSFQWPVEVGCGRTRTDTAYVFTSTLDIANRADLDKAKKASRHLQPGVLVCLNNAQEVARWNTGPDLQVPDLNPAFPPCKL